MTTPGGLVELVSGAFGRTPPLSATYRLWSHLDRLRRAMEATPRPATPEGVCVLIPAARHPDDVRESNDRLWAATQQGSWRVERDWSAPRRRRWPGRVPLGLQGKPDRTSVHVCDGTTMWLPTAFGAFHSRPADPDAFAALNLLDPSWLAGYDWDPPVPGTHNDRDILAVHARLGPGGPAPSHSPTAIRARPPAETEVLIDAQHGFLHRMTGLSGQQPFMVEELLDVVLNPPVDKAIFSIDPSKCEVFDQQSNW